MVSPFMAFAKGAFEGSIYDCLFDGNAVANYGVYLGTWDDLKIHESEFISHNTADIRLGGGSDRAPELKGRNIKFIAIQNAHRYDVHSQNKNLYIPNYFVVGTHEVEVFKKNSEK